MRVATLILLAFTGFAWPAEAQAQAKPKNVVLVIADDLGMELGCYGNPFIKTPHIDSIAKRGLRFTKAYATVSSCSPSRSTILTGLFTHQNGQYGLQHPPHSQQMHPWVQSLPLLLRQAGYFTGLIGKYHTGPDSCYQFNKLMTKGTGRDVAGYARHARDFLKETEKKPFFLVYGFTDPHRAKVGFGNEPYAMDPKEVKYGPDKITLPNCLPDTPATRRDYAEYCQSVSRMDRGVGLLIAALREAGVLDDTLIVFISDNGIPFPGAKTTLYNAGVHLPLIMAGPGVPQGKTSHGLFSYIDLTPTLLDYTNTAGPAKYKLPGRSILPTIGDEKTKGWDAVFQSHQMHEITMMYPMRAITTARYKLIENLDHAKEYPQASDLWGSPTWQDVRTNQRKMLGDRSVSAFLHRPKLELYDMTTDPGEVKNLAGDATHAKTLSELRTRLRQWQRETNDPWLIVNREESTELNR